MWKTKFCLILFFSYIICNKSDPISYYYGLEESERSLPACNAKQACSVLFERYWRPPALVRLCKCARRLDCPDNIHLDDRALELNNRRQFKFCEPTTQWGECHWKNDQIAVTIETDNQHLNPDELEEQHHKNIQLIPPIITFNCKCPQPNYWKLKEDDIDERRKYFNCNSLPLCNTGDYCGNVDDQTYSLYQTCLCPRNHICVQNGGLHYVNITEMLYIGKGRRAFCQKLNNDDYSYEEFI